MCAEVAKAMADRTFFDMADAVTFVLLYQHHRTKQAIASSIAAGAIDPLRTAWDPVRGQAGLSTYRVAGFLNFWVYGSYAGVDWPRFPNALDTQDQFLSWWQTYGIVQGTARQNAINNSLNAIVESEAAWRKAFNDWKAYDLKLVTAQQYSDATVFAHRTLEDAQTAVLRTRRTPSRRRRSVADRRQLGHRAAQAPQQRQRREHEAREQQERERLLVDREADDARDDEAAEVAGEPDQAGGRALGLLGPALGQLQHDRQHRERDEAERRQRDQPRDEPRRDGERDAGARAHEHRDRRERHLDPPPRDPDRQQRATRRCPRRPGARGSARPGRR